MKDPNELKKILVVEDNIEVRATITQCLEMEGYLVVTAEDGIEALGLLKRVTPDLILSDINMPNMNGIELYTEIRANPRLLPIPFIFLTANDSTHDIQAGRELGVEDYLVKPVDIGHLLNIINTRLLKAAEVQLALIGQAYLETVKVLANTIEGRDPYTRGHVDRVSRYAYWLAKELGWGPKRLQVLEFGARLHDIGKIIIPDDILKKTSPLTEEEWSIVKHHPVAGAKIVREISHLEATIPFILFHHERWNGSGYPYGLTQKDIPFEGRLMAIVDVFDALTSERPYHPALTEKQVLRYLWVNAGKLFDPELIPAFIKALKENQMEQPTIVTFSEPQPVPHN